METTGEEGPRSRSQELRDLLDLYKTVADSTYDWEYLLGGDGKLLYVSPVCESLTGYSPDEFLHDADLLCRIIHPEDIAFAADHVRAPVWGEAPRMIDFRILRRDGKMRWISHACRPVFAPSGEYVGRRVSNRDITEYKRIENALRESEVELRHLFDQAPLGIWLLDPEGTVVDCNRIFLEYAGAPREKVIGFNVLTGAKDRVLTPHLQRAIGGERSFVECDYTSTTGGKTGHYRYIFQPIMIDGRLRRVLGIIEDIAERKRAEIALRESMELYRGLVETSPDGITLVGGEGEIVVCNQRIAEMHGFTSPEEMQGMNVIELAVPEDRDRLLANREVILTAGRSRDHSYTAIRKDGSRFPVEMNAILLKEAGGKPKGYLTVVRDVADRRRAEEERRGLEAQVQQAQKMESLGVLAGGVAHDFNNLLVGMLGQTSLALAKLPPDHPARAPVERAVQAAERAAELTRQMLAYSGRGSFERRDISLNSLITQNLRLFESVVPKTVTLRMELDEPLPPVDGDPGQMQQLVMNLVLNAAEAIGQNPGTVVVRTGLVRIDENESRWWQYTGRRLSCGPHVRLEVRDDGCGMDSDTLSRIFDPFFTTKFTGRGLGLAAVLGIVRGHEGGLWVESAPGAGTSFIIVLPVSRAEAAPAILGHMPAEIPKGDLILVIDDEELVRDAVADILTLSGYEVITAADGAAGIEVYQQRAHDIKLVLLDLSMPRMGGEQVFEALKSVRPDAQVVLTSGYSQHEAVGRFRGKGIAGFIQKPYDAMTLIGEVQRYLRGVQVPAEEP